MVGARVEHVIQRLEQGAVLVQQVRLAEELLRLRVVATHDKEVALRRHNITDVVGNIELVGDHDGLRHEVEDLVRVDELGSWLQVEDSWMYVGFKAIPELEVS